MLLAVSGLATIVVATLLLEDDDLVSLRLRNDLGRNGEPGNSLGFAAIGCKQDIAQRHGVTGIARHLFDDDLVSCGNAVLLAARRLNS